MAPATDLAAWWGFGTRISSCEQEDLNVSGSHSKDQERVERAQAARHLHLRDLTSVHESPILTMDANWQPVQGSNPPAGVDPNNPAAAGGDWRAQLQPEARSRIAGRILEYMKKHIPVSEPVGLNELQKIAVRFEEKIFATATNQSDYLRKISLKVLSMETKTPHAPGNAQLNPNQNNPQSRMN
ncbi:hypothetical protein ACQ4PT_066232 [Festuca glaucescens]